jgi:hypothetical protein
MRATCTLSTGQSLLTLMCPDIRRAQPEDEFDVVRQIRRGSRPFGRNMLNTRFLGHVTAALKRRGAKYLFLREM